MYSDRQNNMNDDRRDQMEMRISIQKECYAAGDILNGVIQVRINKSSHQKSIKLTLEGTESYQEKITAGKAIIRRTTQIRLYCMHFQIRIATILSIGIHRFPFELHLPSSLSSSFFHSDAINVKHCLFAQLIPNCKQCFSMKHAKLEINIADMNSKKYQTSQISQSIQHKIQFFGCFWRTGSIKINFSCKKDSVAIGQNLIIRGSFNCEQSTQTLKCARIVLKSSLKINKNRRKDHSNLIVLHNFKENFKPGRSYQFCIEITIPQELKTETFIGKNIQNTFQIGLIGVLGFFKTVQVFNPIKILKNSHPQQEIKKHYQNIEKQPSAIQLKTSFYIYKYEKISLNPYFSTFQYQAQDIHPVHSQSTEPQKQYQSTQRSYSQFRDRSCLEIPLIR